MSRLWAFTCIILALGIGLLAGILVVMYVFVLPHTQDVESKFLKDLPVQQMLQAASPAGTQWDFVDNGSQFHGLAYRQVQGRRWLAECKMPNSTDQASVSTLLTNEFQKAMTPYGGTIYSMGGTTRSSTMTTTTPGPAGTAPAPPTAPGASSVLYQTTMPYGVKQHVGCVHFTVVGEGERVVVSIVVHEN